MQENRRIFIPIFLGGSFALVALLHIAAAWREREAAQEHDGWLKVGSPDSIPDKRARIVVAPDGERIAVFRDGAQIGALTNLCAHQNGPLGEGCIVNGLVTCPWHGYEYRLEDGCAPPPFTERLATYRVRLRDGVIEVDPNALPPGTKAAIRIG
jgi:nitrite reductase/ring-hydroxylating ferredoxin subunit